MTDGPAVVRLVHNESGHTLAERVEVARSTRARMRGLLGRTGLPPGAGMMIERCSSIHTCFMKFALDVVFLDSGLMVRKIVRDLRPWRFAMSPGACYAVELPAGALSRAPLAPGDTLRVEERP